MDEAKLPAPPAAKDTPAPRLSPRERAKEAERARLAALAGAERDRETFHQGLREHLSQVNSEQNSSEALHPTASEHAALRGLNPVRVLDPETMQWVDRPCWQMQAVVARFHAHGLRHDARISHEHFEQALHEALHGRV